MTLPVKERIRALVYSRWAKRLMWIGLISACLLVGSALYNIDYRVERYSDSLITLAESDKSPVVFLGRVRTKRNVPTTSLTPVDPLTRELIGKAKELPTGLSVLKGWQHPDGLIVQYSNLMRGYGMPRKVGFGLLSMNGQEFRTLYESEFIDSAVQIEILFDFSRYVELSEAGELYVRNTSDNAILLKRPGPWYKLVTSPSRTVVVCVGYRRAVAIYAGTCKESAEVTIDCSYFPTAAAIDSSDSWMVCAGDSRGRPVMKRFDLATGQVMNDYRINKLPSRDGLALAPDGKTFAIGGEGYVTIGTISDGRLLKKVQAFDETRNDWKTSVTWPWLTRTKVLRDVYSIHPLQSGSAYIVCSGTPKAIFKVVTVP